MQKINRKSQNLSPMLKMVENLPSVLSNMCQPHFLENNCDNKLTCSLASVYSLVSVGLAGAV